MSSKFLTIQNGQSIDLNTLPLLEFEDFYQYVLKLIQKNAQIVQYFAYQDHADVRILSILRHQHLFVGHTKVPVYYPSLTASSEKFNYFEREIAEQFGIKPIDHPWLKSLRYHSNFMGKPDVFKQNYQEDIPGHYPYYEVEGEEIHQVGVGPVHAGIIEPGHFRFNCIGEKVLHLEIQLGYQYRGIETLFLKSQPKAYPILIESVAGDTTIGHSLCFAQCMEGLLEIPILPEALHVRLIALELERLANHIGDLGALSGDTAFLPVAQYFGRIRGEFLNLLLLLSGNRFGKGLVRPGGVRFGLSSEKVDIIQKKIQELRPQIEHVSDLLFSRATVLSRFESVGTVSFELAEKLGLVGVVARASGMTYDVRTHVAPTKYKGLGLTTQIEETGDVLARAKVRIREVFESMNLIEKVLTLGPVGTVVPLELNTTFKPNSLVVSLNEGWRGELSHCVMTDQQGQILRYKIKDPSFHNWKGLELALRDQEISDFPLCNKSFNLSYCGFDL